MKTKVTDRGYAALVKRVYGLKKPKIKVGIFAEESHKDSDLTVLEIAVIQEFGTDKIPARSFLRAWFDENREKCHEAVARMMKAVIAGKYTKEQALELLAQRFVGEIQRRIAQGIPPPLAPSTVARKGSSTPLIDKGQLRSSITYVVEP